MLLIILGVLLIALLIIIPLVERFGQRSSEQDLHKIARWIFPLLLLLMVFQAIRYIL
jgi:hypothetical protein